MSTVVRYDKKQKKINVPCPEIIKVYKFMGRVDLHDSLTALYRFPIKSKQWYMYVFFYTTNMMVVNVWLRYRKHAQVMKRRPMRLAEFQGRLATQLVSPKAPVGRPRIFSPNHRQSKVHHRSAPPREIRLDGQNHLQEWIQSRERCKAEDCSSLSYI